MTRIGTLLRTIRHDRGYTLSQLFRLCNKTVSSSYLNKIEVRGEIPSPVLIRKLAKALKYNEQELLDAAKMDKLDILKRSLDNKYKATKVTKVTNNNKGDM